MSKILIVDDEKLARDRIRRFIGAYPENFDLIEADNGISALKQIRHEKPDIVFLDIQMPQMNGFDVLYQLEEINFQIVFQTAFDEYAVKAFEVNACDYLLKPYTEETLHRSLAKALHKGHQLKALQALESDLKKKENYLKKIVVKKGADSVIVDVEDVVYFKSEDHYTFAFTDVNEYILDISLNHLEDKLNPAEFFRVHRNSLVRLRDIDSLSSAEESTIRLKNNIVLDISRNSRKKLLLLLQKEAN